MSKFQTKDAEQQQVLVPVEAPNVDAMMIVRTLVFVVALVNAVAAIFGFNFHLTINQQIWYDGISAFLVVASGAYGYWKNNNFTKQARIKAEVAKQIVIKK